MAGREKKNKLIIFCFFLITSVHFEFWLFWGWETTYTRRRRVAWVRRSNVCVAVDSSDFVSKWIWKPFWLAQFSLVLFCWAAPPPLDWIKRSRLREGIGRVRENNWELRLYFFVFYNFDLIPVCDFQGQITKLVGVESRNSSEKCQITWQQSGSIFTVCEIYSNYFLNQSGR